MIASYLYVNALLYAVFGIWCTVSATSTSQNLGYLQLSNSGNSEYLVVYGGLQLGLALFFGYVARYGDVRTGLIFALALYVPIVCYRGLTVMQNWPVTPMTLGVASLELALLVVGAYLWFRGT